MRQFTRFRLFQILVSGVLLAVHFNTVVRADEAESKRISAEDLWQDGVSNMLKLSVGKNSSVCEPLLASLNKHVKNPSLPVTFQSEPKRNSSKPRPFLLLRNEFLIDVWHKQEYRYQNKRTSEINMGSFEAAVLDFDGDGSPDALFRWRSTTSGKDYHIVRFFRSAPDKIVKNQILEEHEVQEVLNESNIFPPLRNWQHILEVVQIAKKPYAIVADAAFLTRKDSVRVPSVDLMKLTAQGWVNVCSYDGLFEITSKY